MALTWQTAPRLFPGVNSVAARVDWVLGPGRESFFADGSREDPDRPNENLPVSVVFTVSEQRLRRLDVESPDFLPGQRQRWPGFFQRLSRLKAQLVADRPETDVAKSLGDAKSDENNPASNNDSDAKSDYPAKEQLDSNASQTDVSNGLVAFSVQLQESFFRDSEELQALLDDVVVRVRVSSSTPVLASNFSSIHDPFVAPLPSDLPSETVSESDPEDTTVVVAVIDDGIGFAHERFRDEGGKTRVEYAWLQEQGLDRKFALGPSPAAVATSFGDEWSKPDIDRLMAECTSAGQVDEDKFYQQAGLASFTEDSRLPKPQARRIAHGTHVMDLFCGYHPSVAPPDRPIVCVQLPRQITQKTNSFIRSREVERAVEYIFARADDIARQRAKEKGPDAIPVSLPVVINFSYGNHAGPHDGSLDLEVFIREVVQTRRERARTVVVLPTGNNFLARGHARMSFTEFASDVSNLDVSNLEGIPDGASHELKWRIQPDDHTDNFLQIWFDENSEVSDFTIFVTPPAGPSVNFEELLAGLPGTEVNSDSRIVLRNSDDKIVAQSVFTNVEVNPTIGTKSTRPMLEIQLKGSANLDSEEATVPAGDWCIKIVRKTELREVEGESSVVQAWIERDDSPVGFRTAGRQSYFNNSCYEVFNARTGEVNDKDDSECIVKRFGNFNGVATDKTTFAVAAYTGNATDGGYSRSIYSAAGSTTGANSDVPLTGARQPDVADAGDDSYVHSGVLAAGSRSGSYVVLSGTSMAAPQFSRKVAAQFAAGKSGENDQVLEQAIQLGTVASSEPDPEIGYGIAVNVPTSGANDPHSRNVSKRRRQQF